MTMMCHAVPQVVNFSHSKWSPMQVRSFSNLLHAPQSRSIDFSHGAVRTGSIVVLLCNIPHRPRHISFSSCLPQSKPHTDGRRAAKPLKTTEPPAIEDRV